MKPFKHRFAGFVLAAVVLSGVACSFSLPGAAPAPTTTPEATQPAQATQGPASLATRAAGALKTQAVPTLPSGGLSAPQLQSVGANLGTLDSYRMSFMMTVKGTDQNNKPATPKIGLLQEVIKSKNESHTQMTGISLAGASDSGALDIYQIDKQSFLYSKSGDNSAAPSCLSFSSGQQTIDVNALLKPEEMLKDIQTAELIAKGEMVNGVEADHYRVSQANLGFGTSKDAGGEIWIAQEGGYAVKFTGTADGSFDIGNNTIDGSMSWEYNLTNINSLQAIQLPPECQSQQEATGDLPVPPNASDIGNLGTLITFSSPDKPAVVASFYRAELPNKGWTITSDSSLGSDLVTFEVTKSEKKMTIMITSDSKSNGSSVLITSK